MGQRGGAAALVVLATLAVPWAGAAPIEGDLLVESGASFPPGTAATVAPLAALVEDTAHGISFRLAAPELTVVVYEKRYTVLGLTELSHGIEERSWRLTDATVETISGANASGYLGFDAAPASPVRFSAASPVDVEHRDATTLSSHGRAYLTLVPEDPRAARYWREVRGAHLYLSAPGLLDGDAGGAIKVQGLDLVVRGSENATTLRTGSEEGAVGERVVRWVHLLFDSGRLHLRADDSPLHLAASHAERVAWSGTARIVARDGTLEAEEVEYASIGPAHVQGTLAASLYPVPGDVGLLRLAGIRGDLTSTSLAPHPRAAVPLDAEGGASAPFLSFLLGIAVSLGGVVAVRAWRARARDAPFASPAEVREWSLAWASFFEEQEDAAAALECLQVARRHMEEDDYDVLLWEASCLDRLGRLDEALHAYEAAVAVAPKGDCEAAFAAAIVAAQLGRGEPSLVHLRLSLMADPYLLEVVDALASSDDDPFLSLRRRQGFRQLLRDARTWVRSAGELSE